MTEQNFLQRRTPAWNEFSEMVLGKKKNIKNKPPSFVRLFREISQDLNTAKAHGFDPAVIERLNMLVNEGYQILYGQHGWQFKKFAIFVLQTFPRAVRAQWRGVLAVMLLFYGIAFFFSFLCVHFPDAAAELVSGYTLDRIESMYDPENEHYLHPRDAGTDADMFGYYIYNNISIAFRTFAAGILAGIGSLFLLCYNAMFMGVITGHIINVEFSQTFFSFIIAHSAFELTAIVFSAYAGLLLGYRFFVPQGLSRSASIKKAGQDALPIIAGSAMMLVIAAVIEAFWSSQHALPLNLRIGVGVAMWVLVLAYFLFAGRKR